MAVLPPAIDALNPNVNVPVDSELAGEVALKVIVCVPPFAIVNDVGDIVTELPDGTVGFVMVTVPVPPVPVTVNVPLVVLAEVVYGILAELVAGVTEMLGGVTTTGGTIPLRVGSTTVISDVGIQVALVPLFPLITMTSQ